MKLENKTDKQLKEDAWKLISKYIRLRNADWRGLAQCYTCKILKIWTELDCGHYIHNKGDFNENNLKPQCSRCNRFLNGNLGVYAENLIKDYGADFVNKLRKEVEKKGNRYTRQELIEIITYYKNELTHLKNK